MNRTRTFSDGLRFTRNAFLIAFAAGVLLFWNSPRPADEITVVIAVPLIIFTCLPILLAALARVLGVFLPEPAQAFGMHMDIDKLPARQPLSARLALGAIVAVLVCFLGACATLLASFTYPYFEVAWAVIPARQLSYLLFGTTALPLVAVFSFFAGMAYTGRVHDSATAAWIYLKAMHLFRHWPTYA